MKVSTITLIFFSLVNRVNSDDYNNHRRFQFEDIVKQVPIKSDYSKLTDIITNKSISYSVSLNKNISNIVPSIISNTSLSPNKSVDIEVHSFSGLNLVASIDCIVSYFF